MKSLKIGFKIEELILLYVKSGNRDGRKSIARLSDWSPPHWTRSNFAFLQLKSHVDVIFQMFILCLCV